MGGMSPDSYGFMGDQSCVLVWISFDILDIFWIFWDIFAPGVVKIKVGTQTNNGMDQCPFLSCHLPFRPNI